VELAELSIYQIFPTLVQVVVTIGALLIIAPILGVIVFCGVFVFILMILYANRIFSVEYDNLRDMWTKSDNEQTEFLRNVSLVKINAKEKESTEEYINNFLNINKREKNLWMKFIYHSNSREIVSIITRTLTIIVGVYLVYKGEYTPGFLVVAFSWSNNAFYRIGWLSGVFRRTVTICSRIQNYFILMDVEPDIKEIDNPIVVDSFKGRIEYKSIFFKYQDRKIVDEDKNEVRSVKQKEKSNALKNINIVIESKQRVAIVGHSGAGKSTLVQLLIRAYDPIKGKILIDGNDLKNLSLDNYRKSLGVVPQDVSLFDNTLRYNILFGTNEDVSDENLNMVLKMARMDGFLRKMENGLDTVIGERGVKLSGGERQRVGIARALVKNPSILIFDEATSSLDAENEALIKDSIKKASKGRTTIIIAHRLSTIKDADKIIVLDNGMVVGEGTHDQLLNNCEHYKRMINFQTVIVGNI
jgi:ATP-binding cassette subfamily B protein